MIRGFVLVAIWLASSFSVTLKPAPSFAPYVAGQVADRYVYNEQAFEYEDSGRAEQLRIEAASAVNPVFGLSAEAGAASLASLDRLRALSSVPAQAHPEGVAPPDLTPSRLSPAGGTEATVLQSLAADRRTALECIVLNPAKWALVERQVLSAVKRGLASPQQLSSRFDGILANAGSVAVVDDQGRRLVYALASVLTPERAAADIAAEYARACPDQPAEIEALKAVLPRVLAPNLVYDDTRTHLARDQAAELVRPVKQFVPPGVPLLRRGERITPEDLVRLGHYQEQVAATRHLSVDVLVRDAGLSVLFLMVLLCASLFLYAIHPEAWETPANVLVMGVVMVGQIFLNGAAGALYYRHLGTVAALLPLVLPLAFGPMLLAQLIGLRTAVWCGLLTALVAAMQFEEPLPLLLAGGLSSFVAAVLMRRARRRYHAFRTGVGVGGVIAVTAAAFLLTTRVPAGLWWNVVPMAFANGVLCAVAASFVMPLFESLFGITTDLSLLELSDLNHPLLKRLQMEAPGTYHHSLMVAALAEEAAAAVGANPLLARVCAYFHDIGKLSNPDYFAENTRGEDPHEDLQPRLSSLVILHHVKRGLELASEYRLKLPIREAITQHHGTSLVYYFFHRARTMQQSDESEARPAEHDFRYPGPLPGRKEIVIVSIADTCEAAVRSLVKPTPQKIRSMVDEVVLKRMEDGQFADADLTFRELSVIQETMIRSLTNMLHGRVRYPKAEEDAEDAGSAEEPQSGSHDSRPA